MVLDMIRTMLSLGLLFVGAVAIAGGVNNQSENCDPKVYRASCSGDAWRYCSESNVRIGTVGTAVCGDNHTTCFDDGTGFVGCAYAMTGRDATTCVPMCIASGAQVAGQ